MDDFLAIFERDVSDAEKLAQGFDWVTQRIVVQAEREIELLRAMHDREALVKEQIKRNTIQFARDIFRDCYKRATGEEAWDEPSHE